MESAPTNNIIIKSKGGRPKKAIKKDQLLGVRCSLIERKIIENKAKESAASVSEYLRKLGLSGKIDMKIKTISKDILEYKGTLNHLAANLNQVAKKRNMNDELDAIERAQLGHLSKEVKQLVESITKILL